MHLNRTRIIGRTMSVLLLACSALHAQAAGTDASAYPVKPVRYVIPFGPGAGNDLVGRVIADRLRRMDSLL